MVPCKCMPSASQQQWSSSQRRIPPFWKAPTQSLYRDFPPIVQAGVRQGKSPAHKGWASGVSPFQGWALCLQRLSIGNATLLWSWAKRYYFLDKSLSIWDFDSSKSSKVHLKSRYLLKQYHHVHLEMMTTIVLAPARNSRNPVQDIWVQFTNGENVHFCADSLWQSWTIQEVSIHICSLQCTPDFRWP